MMGGKLGVVSKEGDGSTFRFNISLKKAKSKPHEVIFARSIFNKFRVLIVDDNTTNCRLLEGLLGTWKFQYQSVNSGQEALTMLDAAYNNNKPYHIVLLDMMMPSMSGLELSQHISRDNRFNDIYQILLSSSDQAQAQCASDNVNIDAFLLKPIRQSQLYNALVNAGHKLETESRTADSTDMNKLTDENLSRILVVEDNKVNQKVIKGILTKFGYNPEIVADGKQAIDAIKQQDFDIIFMDCQMPVMDGYQATKEIRNFQQGARHPVIIAMTANAMPGDREKCLTAGMDDYLSKPVNVNILKAMLEKWGTTVETNTKTSVDD